jgi:hypothetical protein
LSRKERSTSFVCGAKKLKILIKMYARYAKLYELYVERYLERFAIDHETFWVESRDYEMDRLQEEYGWSRCGLDRDMIISRKQYFKFYSMEINSSEINNILRENSKLDEANLIR